MDIMFDMFSNQNNSKQLIVQGNCNQFLCTIIDIILMKKQFSILLLLFPLVAFAQKEDYNWTIANKRIDFNYSPPKITETSVSILAYNLSCFSDMEGNYLFRYGGNKLLDANDKVLHTNIGSLMHSPSLIPFPYDNKKTLFFYADTNVGLCCAVINNDNPSEIHVIKTSQRGKYDFTFVQQKNTKNIWFLHSKDDKIEISLITKDGFSSPSVLDLPYNVSNSTVSQDNDRIIFSDRGNSVLYIFDNVNGVFTKLYEFGLFAQCEFSKSGKYIYNIEQNDANTCDVVRYDIKNATDETTLFSTKYIIGQIPTQEPRPPKLGPDGNIYINVGTHLYAIYDCDTESAYVKSNVVNFDKTIDYLPYTFHYTFENTEDNPCPSEPETPSSDLTAVCASQTKTYRVATPEPNVIYHWTITGGTTDKTIGNDISVQWQDTEGDGVVAVYGEDPETHCVSETVTYNIKIHKSPSASFDNAIACHGQPLKILSSGDAPFDISYTIDGEEHSIKTTENSYQLPDVPGKYVITKIKDASCETVPTANNAAEIAPKMKTLRIVEE